MSTEYSGLTDSINSGSVIPFDQPEVEAVMKKIMLDNGITDVLYEGSNVSQLTSVISYMISTLNINTAINLQETLLPLATKRMNILFGARQLGYEPHTKTSYKYKIFLTPNYDLSKKTPDGNLDTFDTTKRQIGLKRNSVFVSGNNTYYYRGPDIKVMFEVSNFDIQYKNDGDKNNSKFYYEIEVTEGNLLEYTNTEDYPELTFFVDSYTDKDGKVKVSQEFLIPFKDVEDDGIDVLVESPDYTNSVNGLYGVKHTRRTKSKQFLIDETFTYDQNKFIRQENIILEYPVIFFEYNGLGQPVKLNDKILVNVLISKGNKGEALEDFYPQIQEVADELQVVNSLEEYLPQLIEVGSNGETDEEIKQNAPVFNNTANRAVTKLDYIAIASRETHVKEADAWGGEDEVYPITNPPKPFDGAPMLGHIWTSTIPNYVKQYKYFIPSYIEPEDNDNNTQTAPLPSYWTKEKYELTIGSADKIIAPKQNLFNWYQSGSEIIDPNTGKGTGNIGDIIDWLEFYKIITMKLHHRHPLYVDFDFVCDIVKYDLTKSKQKVNSEVFDGINGYFKDQIEHFGSEYINSNLQRILDSILTYQSGIGYETTVQGVLFKDMVDETTKLIQCSLAFPFENMYTAPDPDWVYVPPVNPGDKVELEAPKGFLDVTLLPNIDTPYFGNKDNGPGTPVGGSLTVDYSELMHKNLGDNPNGTALIYYDGVECGTYTVRRDLATIELAFHFDDVGGVDKRIEIFNVRDVLFPVNQDPTGTNLTYTEQSDYARFNLVYPFSTGYNNNIPFSKNTIPRLRKVEFKDN